MLSRALSGPLRRLAAASTVARTAPVASLRAPIAVRAISDTSRSWADALNRPLSESDPELSDVIEHEKQRQRDNLVLIASENFASRAVYDALGSVMSNKYSEGYPGARYYGGNEHIDEAENLCRARALEAFGLDPSEWGVNVQPLSGSPANFQVYTALLKPHDRLMGLDLPHGGHLSHGYELPTKKISAVSTYFEAMPYRLDEATGTVDHDALARSALLFRPKLIIAGASAYSRLFDHARFREVADSVGAVLMSDMAHVSGLVAAGVIPSPFEHCDVVTTTTHKSLRGPRGAMIFFRKGVRSVDKKGNKTMWDLEERINFAVFPGHQGGPHNHTISALATALKQAADPSFKAYQTQVVKNAAAFARALMAAGCDLVSGGTDNHLLLVDLRSQGIDGARLEVTLEKANITTNKNTVPGDTSALTPHGLRLGSPAMTTRGATEEDFEKIAAFIARGIEIVKAHKASLPSKKVADYRASLEDPAAWPAELTALREEVTAYSQSFPTVGYTVDEMKFK